jgi:predicted transcriptional regulator
MIELGLKRMDVAKSVGLAYTSLTNALNGRKPGIQTIKLLSQVLKCEEEDLLYPSDSGQAAS